MARMLETAVLEDFDSKHMYIYLCYAVVALSIPPRTGFTLLSSQACTATPLATATSSIGILLGKVVGLIDRLGR